MTIDGFSQPKTNRNTLAIGNNAVVLIQLDGTNAGAGANGLELAAGNSKIQGLIISSFTSFGILVNSSSNTINGNFVGTDTNNSATIGNKMVGIAILMGSKNTIGGVLPSDRNVISGNGSAARAGTGVWIESEVTNSNRVWNNYIGPTKNGLTVLNGVQEDGVWIDNSFLNKIGGADTSLRNVISGNGDLQTLAGWGVKISGNDNLTNKNLVQGNYFGTDANGVAAIGNLSGGVILEGAADNTIGGSLGFPPTASGTPPGNVISGNIGPGVEIDAVMGRESGSNNVQGNLIGTDKNGVLALPNWIGVRIGAGSDANSIGGGGDKGNTISGNAKDGIDVSSDSNNITDNNIGMNVNRTAPLKNGGKGINDNGKLNQILRNTVAFNGDTGIFETGGSTAIVSNAIFANESDGIALTGPAVTGCGVFSNYIGTDANGDSLGNRLNGVYVANGAFNNWIGNDVFSITPGQPPTQPRGVSDRGNGNTIAFNLADGVRVDGATVTYIEDNVINQNQSDGVAVYASTITSTGLPNQSIDTNDITSNGLHGVVLDNTNFNLLDNNYIATNSAAGVRLDNGASNNLIGGETNPPNIITGNDRGVVVASGIQNPILANSIYGNGLGIDLNDDGVSENDYQDPDAGANLTQNYPVLISATPVSANSINLIGTLNSTPNSSFLIELFYNDAPQREGRSLLASIVVTTDQNGDAPFYLVIAFGYQSGYFTTTATDMNGNTSEFSAPIAFDLAGGSSGSGGGMLTPILSSTRQSAPSIGSLLLANDLAATLQATAFPSASQVPALTDQAAAALPTGDFATGNSFAPFLDRRGQLVAAPQASNRAVRNSGRIQAGNQPGGELGISPFTDWPSAFGGLAFDFGITSGMVVVPT
jgi:hypothetical protein